MEQYLMQIINEGKAQSTVDTYYARLKIFNDYLKATGNEALNLTPRDIIEFKNMLLKKGLSNRYINSILSVVRGYYDYAIIQGNRSDFNPVLSTIKSRATYPRPHVLTSEEQHQFESWASTLQINLYVGYLLMLHGGCRVSEACSLTLADVKLDSHGRLMLNISDAKWGSDRKVPIMDIRAVKIIYSHLKELDITSKPITRCTIRTMQTYVQTYKQETGVDVSCHTLRHTFATRLLESGMPIEQIRRLMGHRTINMTAHYTQQAKIDFKDLAPTIWQA